MITCRLKGGLGNMMFQIAGLESFAKDNNTGCFYYNVDEQLKYLNDEVNFNPSLKHSHEYLTIFKHFNWHKNLPNNFKTKEIVPFKYIDLTFKDNHCYDAYFQSEKFFAHNRDFILKLFEPTDLIKNQVTNYFDVMDGITCGIHVRRGDYVKLKDIHVPVSEQYLTKAMETIGTVDKYLIFSDDIEWCKQQFKGEQFVFIEDKDYIELFLQTMCNHNITSNSSFSWWGAWLNQHPDKIVTVPANWFGPGAKVESNDIYPEGWRKI